MMSTYQLIGTEVSLFSGKARAYLKYKDISFKEILSTNKVYKEIIIPKTGVRYIPVLLTPNGTAIQDTTEIIDFLEKQFPENPVYPNTPKQRLTALIFELFGDERMVLPAMYYRWHFKEENYDFIAREFGKTSVPESSPEEQKATGETIAGYFSGLLPFLGITEKTYEAIEKWYENFLDDFSKHLKQTPFLFGSKPSVGDYGLIGPLYAHLYRDPYPGKMMKSRAPLVADWVERMINPLPNSGEFLADDEVPETLFPILENMFTEFFPDLESTKEKLATWVKEHSEEKIPRSIGTHPIFVGGASEMKATFPYSQWMYQRPVDYYASIPDRDRKNVDVFLMKLGGTQFMQTDFQTRIKRENNILVSE